jgi:hypothetical protein
LTERGQTSLAAERLMGSGTFRVSDPIKVSGPVS